MANSSFPSLEDSSLVDDLASDIARQPSPMQNFVDDFVKDEFSRTQAAARYAKQFDPQSYARAEKLAPGISPEVGIRQLQLLEDTANLARYQDIFERAPSLRGYFAENPKELPKATPDDLDNLSGLSWLGNAAVDSYRQGFIDMQAAFASNRVAKAQLSGQTPSIEDQAFLNNYQGGRTFGADGFWSEAFTMAAQQIGPLLGTMAATFNAGVVGGAGGAAYGSVVPGVGTTVGLATGAAAGSIAGGYTFQQQLQTGMSRLYFQSLRDENGKPLEPELVELASQITGAGGALLETVSLGAIARVIPGVDRLSGLLTKEGMATALKNPTVRGALLEFAKNTFTTAAVETSTEVLQQGLQIAAGELAKSQSEGEFTPITGEEAAQQLLDAGRQAFQVMALMGPLISSTRFGTDLIEVSRSNREHKALNAIIAKVQDNELLKRDPELAAKLIDKQTGGQALYVPAKELVTLFQEQDQDRYSIPIENWRQRLDEALAVDGDVKVSLGEFIAHLSKDPKDNPLLRLARTNPKGYTQQELELYNEAQDQLLLSEVALAQKRGDVPLDRVTAQKIEVFPELEELRKQVEAIGFDKKAVDAYTTIFSAFFQTMAQRTGKTASELFNEYSVEVQRGLLNSNYEAPDRASGIDTSSMKFELDDAIARAAALPRHNGRKQKAIEELDNSLTKYADKLPKSFRTLLGNMAADPENINWESYNGAVELIVANKELPRELVNALFDLEELFNGYSLQSLFAQDVKFYKDTFDSTVKAYLKEPLDLLENWLQAAEQANKPNGNPDWARTPEDMAALKKAIGVLRRADAANLNQGDSSNPRGAIQFEDTKAIITLFESHDMSTLLHEAGHFFLQTFRDLAEQSPELQADWQTIKNKLKIGDDNLISREQHEQFARWTEAYFMEGKAPSPELKGPFEQFRRWLKTVYRTIQKLGGRVSPEISQVFDRMFVVDDRLEQIALDNAYAPLFKTAEEMGVSMEEYLAYQTLVEDLKEAASDKARARIAGQAQRLTTGWMGEIEKQLAKEAEEKLKETPPYTHMKKMREGKLSLNRDELEARGKETVKAFPTKGVKKDGLPLDIAAELLGYPTADDMVYDFAQAKPIKEAAAELAQQEMVTRYGEDYSNQEILDAAIQNQLAADGRLIVLAKEHVALSKKAGRTVSEKGPKQLAAEIARNVIYAKKVGDINPAQTRAAVNRNAKLAEAAALKGDWNTAADYKRKQMLAQALDNEVQKVSLATEKIRNKAARYARTNPPSVAPSFMTQIRALVDQYEFAKISKKKLGQRVALREFLEEQEAEGLVTVDIPDRLLKDAGKVNYKELTVEDLLGLGDTLDNLEHLGRLKQRLATKQKAAEFAAVKQQILTVVKPLARKKHKADPFGENNWELKNWALDFHAGNLKPEQLVEWLDAGAMLGPLAEHVFNPIADAQNLQNELTAEYNQKLVEIFQDVPSKYLSEIINIPEIGGKITRENLYAIALNTGNISSRKKLLEGEIWSEAQLEAALTHMSKEDWDRVQKIWNLLDKLWPRIAALEKKLTGVVPPKIEARAFVTPFGEYDGGYYPVMYDFKAQRGKNLIEDTTPHDKGIGEGLFSKEYIRPGTNHKHTVKRTKTAKVIRLELGVLPGHINNVIHDLAYREAIRSAYKILWDPDIAQAIRAAEGDHGYRQLQHWLRAVATERTIDADPVPKLIAHTRVGATMYGMGYRLTTVVAQVFGLFPAMLRVGHRNMLSAVYQMARHPYRSWALVEGLSGEMKHRFNQQERDIKDTVRQLLGSGNKLDVIKSYAFWAIGMMDRAISTTVWLAAYQQQIRANPQGEEIARRHADRTVRLTQGTGSVKDMAKIMNSGEITKLFTMFYSFLSAQYNMQVDLTRKTIRDIAAGDMNRIFMERLPQWMYLVPIPAILSALVSGQGPEDDEDTLWWMAKTAALYPLAAVPFVRDVIGSAESGFGYKFTPASKAFDAGVAGLREFGKLVTEPEEFDPAKAAKATAIVGSIALKLPGGQAINTVEGLWKGLENGDFEPQDLIYGRRGK